eukprot:903246-Pyramimonas_sp.AAC.1
MPSRPAAVRCRTGWRARQLKSGRLAINRWRHRAWVLRGVHLRRPGKGCRAPNQDAISRPLSGLAAAQRVARQVDEEVASARPLGSNQPLAVGLLKDADARMNSAFSEGMPGASAARARELTQ